MSPSLSPATVALARRTAAHFRLTQREAEIGTNREARLEMKESTEYGQPATLHRFRCTCAWLGCWFTDVDISAASFIRHMCVGSTQPNGTVTP